MFIYTLTDIEFEFSKKYANQFYEKKKKWLAEKDQTDPKRIKEQVLDGVIGEISAFNWLKNKTDLSKYSVSLPCLEILPQASWAPDLFVQSETGKKLNFAVKSMNSLTPFKKSFIFERSDKHVFNNYHKNDCVIFVEITENTGHIISCKKIQYLHEKNLFKDLEKEVLNKIKCAVYLEDII